MSNDLLFSILPRQGTVPIAHDEHKVQKVTKDAALRELNDQEQELHLEEREARQRQQQSKKEQQQAEPVKNTPAESAEDKPTDDKGFKHLDIYV